MACVSQPSPLLAARQRAQALADAGDPGQAIAALQHAVELGRANLGEDDPDVLLTAQQLASVHQRTGDAPAARRVLEEAYAAGQWRLGDTDPVMLLISFDLGVVAEEMENRHEARRAFGRVAAHGPAALGADHWAVAHARSYLGEDPPTVRMELPAEQLRRFQIPPQREAPQDQSLYFAPPQEQEPVRSRAQQPAPVNFHQPPAPPNFNQAPAPDFSQASAPPHFTQASTPPNYDQTFAPPSYNQTSAPPSYDQTSAPPHFGQASAPPHSGYLPQPGPGPGYYDAPPYQQPQPAPQPVSITPAPSSEAAVSAYSRKAPAIFAAIAAVFGVIIAVVALVVVLADRGDDPDSDVPTLAGPAPSDVRLRDYGSSVKLFWADPANGRASFVITGGKPGEQLKPMGQVGPTTTSFDLNGLNADLDYCFAIVAVYTTSQFSTSPQTCTSRSSGGGRPTPSRK